MSILRHLFEAGGTFRANPSWPNKVNFAAKGLITSRSIRYDGSFGISFALTPSVTGDPFAARIESFAADIGLPTSVNFAAATSELSGGVCGEYLPHPRQQLGRTFGAGHHRRC